MSNEQPPKAENIPTPNEDPPPTAPTSHGNWQMPKPVFKKTSGYLPQGFEKLVGIGKTADGAEAEAPDAAADGFAPENVQVGAQPDLSEHLLPEEEISSRAESVPRPKKSPVARIVAATLVLLGMLIFIIVFLYVIITLFFPN